MSRYKPYPEYKDSGVEWIGEVPAHWEVVPIYGMARCNTKTLPETALESEGSFEYIDISAVDHILGIADGEQVEFKMAPSRARRLAEEGDVIISTVRTYLKAVAEVRAEKSRCVFSTGFAVLSPLSHLAPDILKWILLNHLLIQAIEAHSQGLSYPAINTSRLLRLAAALPPQDEQSQIATFLDRETTRIDTLIEKKQRFIELLEEKRQAVITQAVTKGLDPNVPMRDSGVEWIGEVPAHWRLKPIKRFAQFINGMAFKPHEWSDKGTPIIRIENLNGGLSFNHYDGDVDPRYYVHRGDLLFGWSGNKGTSFGPFIWSREGDFYLNQHIFRVDNIKAYTQWLYWVLRAVTKTIEEETHGIIGMVHVTKGKLGAIEIPELPNEEQVQIATFLDRETTRIDTLIEKTRQSIELLKERRSALITAAVTGKIDVREEAAA